MKEMARASSGLAYPERFYAAASYVGFGGSPNPSSKSVTSKFSNDVALLLYALYQQATLGPCTIPKPRGWSPIEQGKWTSWQGLGTMASTEAMRLFVKILEEEDPGWYSRVSNFVAEPVLDVEVNHNPKVEAVMQNGNAHPETKTNPETKTIPIENGSMLQSQDKGVALDCLGSISLYDQWVGPPVNGPRPKARYEHGAAVIDDKMYVFGGNHNGRYLNDLQVLDLRSFTWSRVEVKSGAESLESPSSLPVPPCAGHSLIPWGTDKLLSVAGHTKDQSEAIQVKVFDLQTGTWSTLKTYGKPPVSRGGQSVTVVGSSLIIFGGQDAKRSLLNDLHLLDLETLTWDEIDAVGVPPSPRSDHAAAVHAERYLLIFGGGSHATCFNDLHVLDLQAMEWSRPKQQGEIPSPRAGHAGVTVGENWFIVGGGDNTTGASETVVLNMSTLVWSVVTTIPGRVPLASEGLSLVLSSYNGEDILISFGGYNGRYNNEAHVLKPSHKSTLQSKKVETVPDSVLAVQNATNATRDMESEGQEGKIREIVMDNVDSEPKITNEESLLSALKSEKEELESSLNKEKMLSLQLKQELTEAETRNTDLYKELQSVRGQLATEQSRCFKLEVDVAELRQKLQTMETLQKELELLQRQKAASEQAAALNAKQRQSSGGVWGWLAGAPPSQKSDDD
ncbi:acyl-CoA-binding domain-containing protein 4-like [Rhododendron vialii]|uniref:acyl-CoA-binding domain-containing protein 4-like n=1 Tax=Rhododendron vialii TaxID=182163 RepID=UPI00265EAC4D|nr:acyl-CoA-binding domain-containing protein 4-like [Rhododendron vialii]